METPIKTVNFQKAHEDGRACKSLLDVGWDANFYVYVCYGKAGGTKAAKDYNEWLIDCCREEMVGDEGCPHIIMADFNATPCTLNSVKEMIEDELWEDIGHVAHWWGGTPDQPTCKTRAGAKATRIDGILANMWATPYISGFKVTKDEHIPTHSVLELTLQSKEEQEEQHDVRTLPSLQKLSDEEMREKRREWSRRSRLRL